MLIMSCYTGFFNVRRGWQSLNTGPRFYLRLIRIYTSRTTDGRPFNPETEKPGAYSTPGTPSGRGVHLLDLHIKTINILFYNYIFVCI